MEHFKLMLLNRNNRVLGIAEISKGGGSGTVTDLRVILQYAIKSNKCGKGNLNPGESDLQLTRKLKDACSLMDVQLPDHLIIIPEGKYCSLADEGENLT